MVAVVEVDPGQETKPSRAADEDRKTPPPPQPVGAVRKQRQPTPDHPPYCWMIGEAIDALCEDGGSEEDSISAFIRARHPGVPPAHDRLLQHYLDKHIAEGFFMCTAAGRYVRSPEEDAVAEHEHPGEPAAAGSSEEAFFGSPVAEAKRGRGRPRRDGSSSTSPAGKKDGARSASPRRRGRRRAAAGLTAAENSIPESPVAVAEKKDGNQAASSTPKLRGQRRAATGLAAAEDSVAAPPVAVDGCQAVPSMPKSGGRLRKPPVTTTDSSDKALLPGKKDKVPYTTDKEHEPPREQALVIVGDDSATTSIMDQACAEAPPTTLVDGGQSLELALVTTTDMPVPAATPAMDKKKDGHDASFLNLAPVVKNDGICTTHTAPESSSQACELDLVAADDGSVPLLVAADKKDGVEEAPSATNKCVRQPRKAGSAPIAGKKASSKALSATPKGGRWQCKPAVVDTDRPALTPVAGKKAGRKGSFASPKLTPVTAGGCSTPASVADQDSIAARKLYPVTADKIPDDPTWCLLALPCVTPAAANA
ncbi:hypothetical protein BAE44_0019895 [Dichanthelium oligosanthes]|uniref:H15 domain-containing protein n=1 Tax=Dichanthelium oligosanthes TaxID=888268 RepID=A0A1E5V1X7_9POAL|nr:hypothetical protein BAE44_0019895 [Dichanthelium oligosanthes]